VAHIWHIVSFLLRLINAFEAEKISLSYCWDDFIYRVFRFAISSVNTELFIGCVEKNASKYRSRSDN